MNELSERQKLLLTLIIHEHTRTAQPIGSKTLADHFGLQMSPATIRNEMAQLTEYGYLRQPHTSAGRVPTEEGYRFFVSNLVQTTSLPANTKNTISHQFFQSRQEMDQWLRLAASVLAKQSQAASIVTAPHTKNAYLKHLELIATRGTQVLMVLVLTGGEIQQQLISFDEPVSQEELSQIASNITHQCQYLSIEQLDQIKLNLNASELQVLEAVKEQMKVSQSLLTGEVYLDGLTNVLAEPEFSEPEDARVALRLFEERSILEDLLSKTIMNSNVGGVQVLIGGEGNWQELRQCSIVLARYGIPDIIMGTIGVLGPMRMPYGHTISTVKFVADLLSDLVYDSML